MNGELAFVRDLMAEAPAHFEALQAREAQLLQQRAAVCLTIRQFDPALDPDGVGSSDDWWTCRRPKTQVGMEQRYLEVTTR